MTEQPDHPAPDITWKYDVLRQHPGRWALWGTYAHPGSASNATADLRRLGFEATARGGDVFVRWPEQSA